jgi:hypothetical protein
MSIDKSLIKQIFVALVTVIATLLGYSVISDGGDIEISEPVEETPLKPALEEEEAPEAEAAPEAEPEEEAPAEEP